MSAMTGGDAAKPDAASALEVETVGELQAVVRLLLDKALAQPQFSELYAGVCAQVGERSAKLKFMKIFRHEAQYYRTMDEAPTHVVGPFDSNESALQSTTVVADERTLRPAPADLTPVAHTVYNHSFCTTWVERRPKHSDRYYMSSQRLGNTTGGYALHNGPFESREAASQFSGNANPLQRLLLSACQRQLQRPSTGSSDVKVSEMEAEIHRLALKRREVGTCRFLGALYRKGVVEAATVHACITLLLDVRLNIVGELEVLHPDIAPDEVRLEALCELLTLAGEKLEAQSKDAMVGMCFWHLEWKVAKDPRLSRALIAKIQTLVDFRRRDWGLHESETIYSELADAVARKRARTH